MTWTDEVDTFLRHADGDLGVFVALLALRKTENGGPGRQMGVLSVDAPTFDAQVWIAANTLRRNELRFQAAIGTASRETTAGLFTTDYLQFFSHRYAPIGAKNDPTGLNANHFPNLSRLHRLFGDVVCDRLRSLPDVT